MLRSILLTGAYFSATVLAVLDQAAKTNVALYFGAGTNQQTLGHFCTTGPADVIPLAFLNEFLTQGNGYPGTNFGGNTCNGTTFTSPGYMGSAPGGQFLDAGCNVLSQDILTCQSLGKKVVLSLGGAVGNYALTSVQDGQALADFLWGAFGPLQPGYTGPRPFDLGSSPVTIDGFDFDIEQTGSGPRTDVNLGYYEALITRLRQYYATDASKQYLITGSPQCVVPDANMNSMITNVAFDLIFVQYYNTPSCSARNFVDANPNYATTGVEIPSGFETSWVGWTNTLRNSASVNARLYIGLPGSTADVSGANAGDVISTQELANLLQAQYFCDPYFGGIMIFEAQGADRTVDAAGNTYTQSIKNLLLANSQDPVHFSCVRPTSTSSTVSSTVVASTVTSLSTGVSTTSTVVSTSVTTSATTIPVVASSSSVSIPNVASSSSVSIPVVASSSSVSIPIVKSSTISSIVVTTSTGISNGSLTTATISSTLLSTSIFTTATPVPASPASFTTSTVQTTVVSTIYQCAPTVTNCPYQKVVTSTIDLYTTICPVVPAVSTETVNQYITQNQAVPTLANNNNFAVVTTLSAGKTVIYTVVLAKSSSTSTASSPSSPSSSSFSFSNTTTSASGALTTTIKTAPAIIYSTIVVVPQAATTSAGVFVTFNVPAAVVSQANNRNGSIAATGTGMARPANSVLPFTGGAGRAAVGSVTIAMSLGVAILALLY